MFFLWSGVLDYRWSSIILFLCLPLNEPIVARSIFALIIIIIVVVSKFWKTLIGYFHETNNVVTYLESNKVFS